MLLEATEIEVTVTIWPLLLRELSRVEETDKITGCFGTSPEGPWKVGKGVIR